MTQRHPLLHSPCDAVPDRADDGGDGPQARRLDGSVSRLLRGSDRALEIGGVRPQSEIVRLIVPTHAGAIAALDVSAGKAGDGAIVGSGEPAASSFSMMPPAASPPMTIEDSHLMAISPCQVLT
jgi:hypothetical protein